MGAQSCSQPGAVGVVGTYVCLQCHNGTDAPDVSSFPGSAHAKVGCEACHGPGALHVRNGLFIYDPRVAPFAQARLLCAQCHPEEVNSYEQSKHSEEHAVTCVNCHDVHAPNLTHRNALDNTLCLDCHEDRGFETAAAIEAHTFHPVDPAGTGASRCEACHMAPFERVNQATGPHSHSMNPVPPIASNQAAAAGVSPVPPNSCAGIMGCHDGSVVTAPVFNVDDLDVNARLQVLFDARYGVQATDR